MVASHIKAYVKTSRIEADRGCQNVRESRILHSLPKGELYSDEARQPPGNGDNTYRRLKSSHFKVKFASNANDYRRVAQSALLTAVRKGSRFL